jgi:putative endopeptidase
VRGNERRVGAGKAATAFIAALCLFSAAPAFAQTARRFGTYGLDLTGRNTALKPGDDFNAFANGRYLDQLKIPNDRTGYGVNYLLTELSETQVHAILEESAKAQAAGTAASSRCSPTWTRSRP